MEQYRSSLAPRTQRRSQKFLLDTAKEHNFFYTSKLFVDFFVLQPSFVTFGFHHDRKIYFNVVFHSKGIL